VVREDGEVLLQSDGGGGRVPAWARAWASWTVVIGAGIAVSILWVGRQPVAGILQGEEGN
jgi:hypothetical protein